MIENKLLLVISLVIIISVCALAIYDIGNLMMVKNVELLSVDSPLIFYVLLTFALLVFAIYVIIDEVRKGNLSLSASPELKKEIKSVVIYAVGTMIYVSLLRRLHFTMATMLFMFLVIMVLNNTDKNLLTKVSKSVISACITVPVLYYVFYGIFKVMLP